ncbi:hypothetical protein GCM10010885_05160 [Alicyclobacillus cellulosilyticus]|uniref:Uncharacterized protein n=1 Tax=Alicyclobacillus cellulosilyticus TaxID=1003997 RepID=A0A917K581_9BACL|nr:hypothetical protein [Alicyclobacillus cellulosilyticus]GGI98617.1 hypothetical protein GCM10010885_05160 [Alicyclobacillus cellulosilyticus]
MPMAPEHVYLYAAVPGDYEKALAAADVAGIPRKNVIGNFQRAWSLVGTGTDLVIAVGGAALFALYYNPCGWPNPAGQPGGHTPFETFPAGQGVDAAKAGFFVNAAGYTALDSLKLCVMLAYYAVHGVFPHQWTGLPRQEVPQQRCVAGSVPNLVYRVDASLVPTVRSDGPQVGIYASFCDAEAVRRALQLGWPGVAATGGLGIRERPYTHVLPGSPDKTIASVLSQTGGAWWLSFWTVSWPTAGDAYREGGYVAGQYVAKQFNGFPGQVLPNYVILDPEGYNVPASSFQDWQTWVTGWAEGVRSVHPDLTPALYCNQSQYVRFGLEKLDLPVFVAVSPIRGQAPAVKGGNIRGYCAFYAACPAAADVATVRSWGGVFNTVQFRDSGVDCGPAV